MRLSAHRVDVAVTKRATTVNEDSLVQYVGWEGLAEEPEEGMVAYLSLK